MKTWTVKTIVGLDHKVSFTVPDDIPVGPLEMVIVTQVPNTIEELEWTKDQAPETASKEEFSDEDWNAHGIEVYNTL